jgi:spore cortex protein
MIGFPFADIIGEGGIHMNRAKFSTATLTCLMAVGVVACGPANNAASDVAQTVNRTGNAAGNVVNRTGNVVNRTVPGPVDERVRVETKLAHRIDAISGVNGATVLLANRMAYIGVGLQPHISDAQMRKVKQKVIRVTKAEQPSVTTVYVSANPGAVHQLQTFAGELQRGRPVSGTWNRFQNMVERIWPHHG